MSSGCIASILRLHSLYIAVDSKDPTWDKTGTVYWSAVELNVGIMCASMTTLRPLVCRIFPGAFTSNSTPRLTYITVSGSGRSAVFIQNESSSFNLGLIEGVGRA